MYHVSFLMYLWLRGQVNQLTNIQQVLTEKVARKNQGRRSFLSKNSRQSIYVTYVTPKVSASGAESRAMRFLGCLLWSLGTVQAVATKLGE